MSGGNYVGGPAWASQADMEIAGAAMAQGGRASSYGAIAYSPATGQYGWSCKTGDRATAERMAIDSCGAADATILVWAGDAYLALALGDGRAYGSAWHADRARAEQLALEICGQKGTNCQVAMVFDTRRDLKQHGSQRRWRKIRAVIFAVVAVAFAVGALYDRVSGYADPRPSLVIALIFGLMALHQARGR